MVLSIWRKFWDSLGNVLGSVSEGSKELKRILGRFWEREASEKVFFQILLAVGFVPGGGWQRLGRVYIKKTWAKDCPERVDCWCHCEEKKKAKRKRGGRANR